MRVMLGKSAKTYTTGEGGKLDGVATLVTDLARSYSTTKQNPHMCNQTLYVAIYDLVKWRISVGEGLLQMGLPSKEAAQLTDPGKDGIYKETDT